MATDHQVTRALYDQLLQDAAARVKQAGAFWQNRALSFFYGASPHSEISVDICIKKAVLRVLTDDHAKLPNAAWSDLASSINTAAIVSVAISKMADVLTHEIFPEGNGEDT
jgi:hypothetical protein